MFEFMTDTERDKIVKTKERIEKNKYKKRIFGQMPII